MRKSVFVASALMLALSGAAFAQGAGGGTGGAGGMGGGAGAGGSSIGGTGAGGGGPTHTDSGMGATDRTGQAGTRSSSDGPTGKELGRRNEHGRGKLGGHHRAQHQDPLKDARSRVV